MGGFWRNNLLDARSNASPVLALVVKLRGAIELHDGSSRTPDETDLPRKFRSVARLYMRGSTVSIPSNLQPHAYVCVGFRDHIVQRMEFDDHENHQKSWNDTDDCAC